MNNSHLHRIRRNYFVISFVVLIVISITLQLYLLTNVGTKGEELNNILNEQTQIKVQNEILKAKIMQLRSNQMVLDGLAQDPNIVAKQLILINPDELNIAAQN
jgi:hypothetical protein